MAEARAALDSDGDLSRSPCAARSGSTAPCSPRKTSSSEHPARAPRRPPDLGLTGRTRGARCSIGRTNRARQMHVNMADSAHASVPRMSLPPDSPMVMRNSRHPVTEAGFDSIVDRSENALEEAAKVSGGLTFAGMETPPGAGSPPAIAWSGPRRRGRAMAGLHRPPGSPCLALIQWRRTPTATSSNAIMFHDVQADPRRTRQLLRRLRPKRPLGTSAERAVREAIAGGRRRTNAASTATLTGHSGESGGHGGAGPRLRSSFPGRLVGSK